MDLAGDFETHLTVRLDQADDLARLRAWAQQRGYKCTRIVLEQGQFVSQPMLTFHGHGTLSAAMQTAVNAAAATDAAGFSVTRIKIEAAPTNQGVPVVTDTAGTQQPSDRYFEHHTKLLLEPGETVKPIIAIARSHGAHVSRNALRRRTDGCEERFVTQRCFKVGRDAAEAALRRLVDGLGAAGYQIIDVEQEFVVFDTNLALDAGWIGS
jgi:hypothetical protein